MTKTNKVPEKVKIAVKLLNTLGKKPKGSAIDIIGQLEKLGYQWDNDAKTWINAKVQTTIMVRSDVTIIDELLEKILELVTSFDVAELELRNNPIVYQAKDRKGVPIENMKQFYLVYQNNSLEQDISLDEDVDVDSILNEE